MTDQQSKTDMTFAQCVKNWDFSPCWWEDEVFVVDLHKNNNLDEWRETFEDQFPYCKAPETLSEEEVTEVLRRLRERFPLMKFLEYRDELKTALKAEGK